MNRIISCLGARRLRRRVVPIAAAMLVGACFSFYSFKRASQYQQAYDRYRRHRAHLLSDDETNSSSH